MKSQNTLIDCIQSVVKTQIDKLDYLIQADGTIMKILANSKYRVQMLGAEYDIYAKNNYSIGQKVKVLIPQNNYKKMFIIEETNNTSNNIGITIKIEDIPNLKEKLVALEEEANKENRVIEYTSIHSFPNLGEKNVYYKDAISGRTYIWGINENGYKTYLEIATTNFNDFISDDVRLILDGGGA